MADKDGFFSAENSDEYSDEIAYLDGNDENYENDYPEEYLCENLGDLGIEDLKRDLNNIFSSLEKYEHDPTENIKVKHFAFNHICDHYQSTIKTSLPLKELIEKIKKRLAICDVLFEDIQFAQMCDEELKKELQKENDLEMREKEKEQLKETALQKEKDEAANRATRKKIAADNEAQRKNLVRNLTSNKPYPIEPQCIGKPIVANKPTTGDPHIDRQLSNYKKWLDRL